MSSGQQHPFDACGLKLRDPGYGLVLPKLQGDRSTSNYLIHTCHVVNSRQHEQLVLTFKTLVQKRPDNG